MYMYLTWQCLGDVGPGNNTEEDDGGQRRAAESTTWLPRITRIALPHEQVRYDTIRDATLTCARKPT